MNQNIKPFEMANETAVCNTTRYKEQLTVGNRKKVTDNLGYKNIKPKHSDTKMLLRNFIKV